MATDGYVNIREILGELIGARVLDITQHDKEEFEATGESYIMLLFDNGCYAKFIIGDEGFSHNCGEDEDDEDD